MFCIDNRCTDVYFNLAAEEYLLKKKKDNFFMMWQSVPSVVIGKHQSVRKEVDEKYIHENISCWHAAFPVAGRFTMTRATSI